MDIFNLHQGIIDDWRSYAGSLLSTAHGRTRQFVGGLGVAPQQRGG